MDFRTTIEDVVLDGLFRHEEQTEIYFVLEGQNEPIVATANSDGSTWYSYIVLPQ